MNVALNAQLISEEAGYRSAGVSTYSAELVRALGALALAEQHGGSSAWEFSAYLHANRFEAPGVRLFRSSRLLERPAVRILWEQARLPLHLRRQRADLVHGLVNVLPLAAPCPGVVTVHDLSFVRLPQALPPVKRVYLTALCRASVKQATQIIAVSRQTADDLQRYFLAPADRINVVYNGVSTRFRLHSSAETEAFRQQNVALSRYLFYLGTLEPRKNLALLLRAFARWRAHCDPTDREVKLVLAGGKGWWYAEIFRIVQELGLADVVHFPGFVSQDTLPLWYASAEIFVYPSLFEGFGLPVLEAMASGTPVICSRAPGVQEVAGDAAVTFDPQDEDELVAALHQVMSQPELRQALRQRGLARAAHFSWQRCAQETCRVYLRAAMNL